MWNSAGANTQYYRLRAFNNDSGCVSTKLHKDWDLPYDSKLVLSRAAARPDCSSGVAEQVATMKEILADHGGDGAIAEEGGGYICRHGAENMDSICGYIAEVGQRKLHVRRGHGCTGTWTEYAL